MKVHVIDINVSAESDEYPSLRFQDIRKKPASQADTRTNRKQTKHENSMPPPPTHTHIHTKFAGVGDIKTVQIQIS